MSQNNVAVIEKSPIFDDVVSLKVCLLCTHFSSSMSRTIKLLCGKSYFEQIENSSKNTWLALKTLMLVWQSKANFDVEHLFLEH